MAGTRRPSMRPHDGVGSGREPAASHGMWQLTVLAASLALWRPANGSDDEGGKRREQEWAGLVRSCGLRRWALGQPGIT